MTHLQIVNREIFYHSLCILSFSDLSIKCYYSLCVTQSFVLLKLFKFKWTFPFAVCLSHVPLFINIFPSPLLMVMKCCVFSNCVCLSCCHKISLTVIWHFRMIYKVCTWWSVLLYCCVINTSYWTIYV